jgi:hypothetical protein
MLAISLHATNDPLRDVLVPLNKKYDLEQLMAGIRAYPGLSNARRVTFEYVMLKGVNDSPDEARALLKLIEGIPAKVNLIPFNPWPGTDYECSDWKTIERFAAILNKAGYASPIRTPRGRDILAACGQLKSESEKVRASALRKAEQAMVVVPGLAHGREGGPGDVVGLNPGLLHQPGLRTAPVGQMADEPVTDHRGADPGADAPDDESPAADQPERRRDRYLLQHPRPFEEAIEPVPSDAAVVEGRRLLQNQPPVHLPYGVDQHRSAVGQIVVAVGLALGPVAQVVGADHPERSAHSHRRPEPDEDMLQP